jgi:hypothetical protein
MTEPTTNATGGATSELLGALGQDVGRLIKEEVDRVRREFGESLRTGRDAGVLLGGAGALGLAAGATSTVLVVRVLDSFLPRPVAALVATGLFGGGAALLGRAGLTELRRAQRAVPPL